MYRCNYALLTSPVHVNVQYYKYILKKCTLGNPNYKLKYNLDTFLSVLHKCSLIRNLWATNVLAKLFPPTMAPRRRGYEVGGY
jgi:hypothetical protein